VHSFFHKVFLCVKIGFNTAVLQTYARKTDEAIDTLTFRTNVLTNYRGNISSVPEDGVNIHGLFIQGASWNTYDTKLKEPSPGELWFEMPCIWLYTF
jgi:dynein heavy chain